ncbi:MAG: guanylate kinase [Planctomycetes bacterium]|nr:guanylate kinase [Planctomycetota bacterium]
MGVRGTMLVVSGPSGCGKSTICKRLVLDARVEFSVSATTRAPRAGEVDGREYHFLDKARFRAEIEHGAFIEWAEVHGNLYGTPRAPMEAALAAGRVFLLEIDVQGGKQLKALGLPGIYLFIAPPDMHSLRTRLERRGTDTPEVIERRMAKAGEEMRALDQYDHVVVNHELERAVAEVRRLAGLSEPQGSAR